MRSAEELRALLDNANVRAFLRVIREGESNQDDSAYTLINGGGHFSDFSRHPYAGLSTAEGGRAAGAYQFIPHTWDALAQRYALADFSPPNQDFAAVADAEGRGAIDAILSGDLATAVQQLHEEWVSLPRLGIDRVSRVFTQYGGGAASAPPPAAAPPLEEEEVQAPVVPQGASPMPLLLSLLPTVLAMFAPRAQAAAAKITGQPPEVANQFVQSLFDQLQQLTGKPDPIQATAALQANPDPAVVAQLEDHTLDYLDKIAPMIDRVAKGEADAAARTVASQDAAAGRNDSANLRPPLARNIWIAVAILASGILLIIGLEVGLRDTHQADNDLMVLLATMVTYMLARLGDVYGFAFGGVQQSQAGAIAGQAAQQALVQKK